MPNVAKIPTSELTKIKKLYYKKGFSMSDIASEFSVSVDAVVYFMRKHNLKRRNFSEANAVLFEKKPASFLFKPIRRLYDRELKVVGAMLYWAEGYKSDKASGIDFANSNPEMISLFMKFLRNTYKLDESKLRIFIYCYSDQNYKKIKGFWSELTKVPKEQFSKPYVREDFRKDGRKMPFGLIHIRYNDKKLLLEIKSLIECYKRKFRVGSPVGSGSGL